MYSVGLSSPLALLRHLPSQNYFQIPALTPFPLSHNVLRKQSLSSTRLLTISPRRSSLCDDSSAFSSLFLEKDWSFLDVDSVNSGQERCNKICRIIAAGVVREGSRILVCMGNEFFIDRLMERGLSCELLLVIHESLLALATIIEKHDDVRCWQGKITALPESFSRFDVVFVCYFPGMGVSLDQLLSSAGSCCSPGGRVVIGFEQGRGVIERTHRPQYADRVTAELPDRAVLEEAAARHSFQITQFVDEPAALYLAVLAHFTELPTEAL